MPLSIMAEPKRRGRPPAGGRNPMYGFRMSDELRNAIDAWREAQPDKPSRSESIRQLVELGLRAAKGEKAKGTA